MQFILSALPTENPGVMAIAIAPLFSADECDQIIASASPDGWEEGELAAADPENTDQQAGREHRSVLQQRLPQDSSRYLARVLHHVSRINSEYHRFDLHGISQLDPTMLLKYSAARSDRYEWHVDFGPDNSSRKLSFAVQLSSPNDYEGGDLQFLPPISSPVASIRDRGMLVVFPSFYLHGVTPITAGVRLSLVGWVHGNAFR